MIAVAPRAGSIPNRIDILLALRQGSGNPGEIVAKIRERAGERCTANLLRGGSTMFGDRCHTATFAGARRCVPADVPEPGG
jgi:hypothetical protein